MNLAAHKAFSLDLMEVGHPLHTVVDIIHPMIPLHLEEEDLVVGEVQVVLARVVVVPLLSPLMIMIHFAHAPEGAWAKWITIIIGGRWRIPTIPARTTWTSPTTRSSSTMWRWIIVWVMSTPV